MDATPDGLEAGYQILAISGRILPTQYFNMVLSKFMRTLRYGNEYFKLIDSDSYYTAYRFYILRLLNRDNTIVRLAVLSEDTDVCLGWSLSEGSTLHYVYVAKEQRGQGIAKRLVPQKIDTFTHLTKAGLSLWNNKAKDAKFNPFA